MQTGRSFAAHFEDNASREAYLAWSASQMLVYNAKVEESNYFWKFHCKFWSPEPLPKPDQKYAHLVNPDTVPWVKEVPSAVRGIGAYRFYQAMTRFMRGLSKRPHRKPIRNADRQLTLTRDYFSGGTGSCSGSSPSPGVSFLSRARISSSVSGNFEEKDSRPHPLPRPPQV